MGTTRPNQGVGKIVPHHRRGGLEEGVVSIHVKEGVTRLVPSPPDAQKRRSPPPLDDSGGKANFGGNGTRPRLGRGGARCKVRAAEAVADKLMKEAMDNVRLKLMGPGRGVDLDEGRAEEERRREMGLETAMSKNSKFDVHWARSEVIGPKP